MKNRKTLRGGVGPEMFSRIGEAIACLILVLFVVCLGIGFMLGRVGCKKPALEEQKRHAWEQYQGAKP